MKFRVSVMKLIKTDEVAPWNPNEFVFRCSESNSFEIEGKNYTEGFEKSKKVITDEGYYSISLRNVANKNGRSKTWRIEVTRSGK